MESKELVALAAKLQKKPRFDLDENAKKSLDSFLEASDLTVEGWSLVPHPRVVEKLLPANKRPTRFIVIVETRRVKLYWAVRQYLESLKYNVNSYFTGGSADFLCDALLAPVAYDQFTGGLVESLRGAGADKLTKDVWEFISVFRVDEPLYLCGTRLKEFGEPSDQALRTLVASRRLFEEALRNYEDKRFVTLFQGKARRAQDYVRDLYRDRLIVGFRPVLDYSLHLDREYVPIVIRPKALDTLLERKPSVVDPVVELLRVSAVRPADEADREVTHIFINHYSHPALRQQWKQAVYGGAPDEVNTFSFPLEGTLNETLIVLSDLPELLAKADRFRGVEQAKLGSLDGVNGEAVDIGVPLSGLGFHGVTLGEPGTGKTNSDSVLVMSLLAVLDGVVVLDASGSLRSKLDLAALQGKGYEAEAIAISTTDDLKRLDGEVAFAKGLLLVEPVAELLKGAWEAVVQGVMAARDVAKNTPRPVHRLLLVEEAGDLVSQLRDGDLLGFVNKAFRKGWCVWLSAQFPSQLGHGRDAANQVISSLQNRLLHRIKDATQRDLLLEGLESAGVEDAESVVSALATLEVGRAWVVMSEARNEKPVSMPALPIRVNKL